MQVNRILGDQTFSQRGDDMVLGNTRNNVRVHILRFGADRYFQDFQLGATRSAGAVFVPSGTAADQDYRGEANCGQ